MVVDEEKKATLRSERSNGAKIPKTTHSPAALVRNASPGGGVRQSGGTRIGRRSKGPSRAFNEMRSPGKVEELRTRFQRKKGNNGN